MGYKTFQTVANWSCPKGQHAWSGNLHTFSVDCDCNSRRDKPSGVSNVNWLSAMTRAGLAGQIDLRLVGAASGFTLGKFNFRDGRQEEPQSWSYLTQKGGYGRSMWQKHIRTLRDLGWLTQYAEAKVASGSLVPMYLLTIPAEQAASETADPLGSTDPWGHD